MPDLPTIGQPAPDFTASIAIPGDTETENLFSLEDFQGTWVLLYFYPKDDTPGCTTQACDLRDHWSEIPDDLHIFGISVDSVKKHHKFIAKYNLTFPLISDEDHTIVEAYGVWVEKKLYGKTYMGTERTSFLIDPMGLIRAVFPKSKPANHLELITDEFNRLTSEESSKN